MMELLNHVLKREVIEGEARFGETSKANRNPNSSTGGRNVKSIVQFYERCNSGSKTIKEGGEQDIDSTMQVRRSPRQKPSVPCFQQHPVTPPMSRILVDVAAESAAPPPEEATSGMLVDVAAKSAAPPPEEATSGILVDVAAKSAAPPPEEATSGIFVDVAAKSAAPPPEEAASDASTKDIGQGNRRVKRKISSSVHKEIIQAVENASKIFAESIDRIHSTKLQIAENKVKAQENLFYTELDYMKKRDRQVSRKQKNLISAINGLTKIITTGLKNTASAGDAVKENARGGDIDIEATGQETLQTVDKTTQQAADAQ